MYCTANIVKYVFWEKILSYFKTGFDLWTRLAWAGCISEIWHPWQYITHRAILNMAASAGSRSSTSNNTGMEGFPFPVVNRPTEDSTSKDQTTTGEPKKKPCRACTDFKSWMKLQKQTSSVSVQVNSGVMFLISDRETTVLNVLYSGIRSQISVKTKQIHPC